MQELRNVFIPIDVETTIAGIEPEAMATASIPVEHAKLLVKTIRAIPNHSSNLEVLIVDSVDPQVAEILYSNTAEYSTGNFTEGIYDMIDIPYNDLDDTSAIHVMVKNLGATPVDVILRVTGLTTR